MAVDFKALNEDVNALARQMTSGNTRVFHDIIEKLYISCDSEEDTWVYYGPLKQRVPIRVYNEALLSCLEKYDSTKGASFITLFTKILHDDFAKYCKKRYSVTDGDKFVEVTTVSVHETGEDGTPVIPEIPDGENPFLIWEANQRNRDIAGIVAYHKKIQASCKKNSKTYIESFFTLDITRCARFGGALMDDMSEIDAEDVCKHNDVFYPAMDDVILVYMMTPAPRSMEQVIFSALHPLIEKTLRQKGDRGKLVSDAYEGHPKYQITRQTAYKKRDTYDDWLLSITAEEQFWKEGYSL